MSDEKVDPLTVRIDRINEAIRQLSALAYNGLIDGGKPKTEADKVDIVNAIQALGVVFGTIVVSLSEIADSVGKIARQSEADFKSAVDAAAEQKADVKATEINKRSFIGQRRKD